MSYSTRTLILIGVSTALVAGLPYVSFCTEPVPVDLATVTQGPLEVKTNADGQSQVRDLFEVASPILGTAMSSPIAEGDVVRADETQVAIVQPASFGLLDAPLQIHLNAVFRQDTVWAVFVAVEGLAEKRAVTSISPSAAHWFFSPHRSSG